MTEAHEACGLHACPAHALLWRAASAILHASGAISFWNATEGTLREDSKVHRCGITSMAWDAQGGLLATGNCQVGKVNCPVLSPLAWTL